MFEQVICHARELNPNPNSLYTQGNLIVTVVHDVRGAMWQVREQFATSELLLLRWLMSFRKTSTPPGVRGAITKQWRSRGRHPSSVVENDQSQEYSNVPDDGFSVVSASSTRISFQASMRWHAAYAVRFFRLELSKARVGPTILILILFWSEPRDDHKDRVFVCLARIILAPCINASHFIPREPGP